MKLLTSLVIFLTVLIALAVGLLGYGFFKRAEDPNWRLFHALNYSKAQNRDRSEPTPPVPEKSKLTPWGHINLNLPSNCRLSDFQGDGSRLYLMTEPVGECQKIIVIETDTGLILGTINPGP